MKRYRYSCSVWYNDNTGYVLYVYGSDNRCISATVYAYDTTALLADLEVFLNRENFNSIVNNAPELVEQYNNVTDTLQIPGIEVMIACGNKATFYTDKLPLFAKKQWVDFIIDCNTIEVQRMCF